MQHWRRFSTGFTAMAFKFKNMDRVMGGGGGQVIPYLPLAEGDAPSPRSINTDLVLAARMF